MGMAQSGRPTEAAQGGSRVRWGRAGCSLPPHPPTGGPGQSDSWTSTVSSVSPLDHMSDQTQPADTDLTEGATGANTPIPCFLASSPIFY